MTNWLVFGLGFLAQGLFSSRIFLQWIVSEKHKKVLTPRLFWEISLLASCLLFIYGYLRDDFAIMLGQVITYYIYIRNIQLMQEWEKISRWLRMVIYFFPAITLVYGFNNNIADRINLFYNKNIPLLLMVFGIVAQVLFTLRFVYQWWYSESLQESILPMGFWLLSLTGSLLIFIYAIFRRDPVLFVGHLSGIIIYSRNMVLLKKYGH
ncbi:MAG: lipid-A-disaccharide synthase N-terminal domain-containing protein [Smithella sp.]|nr:lipid-A-disaccharide synthase N-terminal domain-containing protein [Smithella sp.]HOU51263.1 lipid-A-disaccharide synthase N-terminal domain-containing protein [Smithella sp.]HQG64884.1 lipid-A-disaccharide synthase N-terminal domain-containing protein [Smithella sp.]HQH16007.1 lipid-A-disaccharide synthase N-terminal domain-containing protein [Smithella sp.]HQI72904.1 lipid-A-disaccharide synthase N-terminal domain-containing protein [Smithella sp.]